MIGGTQTYVVPKQKRERGCYSALRKGVREFAFSVFSGGVASCNVGVSGNMTQATNKVLKRRSSSSSVYDSIKEGDNVTCTHEE